jgi:uncharacterized membrane protein
MEQMSTEQDKARPGQEDMILAMIGYLPMMFFIPLLVGKPNSFARFHGRQSLFLFVGFAVLWVAIWIVDVLFGRMMGNVLILGFLFRAIAWLVYNVVGVAVSLLYLALAIAAIVQAALGREWRIPFLSAYMNRLQFWN